MTSPVQPACRPGSPTRRCPRRDDLLDEARRPRGSSSCWRLGGTARSRAARGSGRGTAGARACGRRTASPTRHGSRLVSARMFTARQGADQVRPGPRRRAVRGAPPGSVLLDDALSHRVLGLPAGPQAARPRPSLSTRRRPCASVFGEPWARSELVAYTPEKAATVRCTSRLRCHRRLRQGAARRRGAAQRRPSCAPRAGGFPPTARCNCRSAVALPAASHQMALFSAGSGDPAAPAAPGAGPRGDGRARRSARRVLHRQPTDGFPPFTRLDAGPAGAAAGELVRSARPDAGRPRPRALVGLLLADPPAAGAARCCSTATCTRRTSSCTTTGSAWSTSTRPAPEPAAAELGGTLARLWCPRPGDDHRPRAPPPPPPTRCSPPTRRPPRARRAASGTPPPPCSSSARRARSAASTCRPWPTWSGCSPRRCAGPGPHAEEPRMTRPRLLFYCQHSVGLGHLVRSMNLADGLAGGLRRHPAQRRARGRRTCRSPPASTSCTCRPSGSTPSYALVSRDERFTVEQAVELRRSMIQEVFHDTAPDVLLVELFPFGRKKFARRAAAAARGGARPRRPAARRGLQPPRHPRRQPARPAGPRRPGEPGSPTSYFDAVLVHADARFATLDETFHPTVPLQHAGALHRLRPRPATPHRRAGAREPRVLVSAGGGLVGRTRCSALRSRRSPRLLPSSGCAR